MYIEFSLDTHLKNVISL